MGARKGGSLAVVVLPAFAGFEAEGAEQAGEVVEGFRGGGGSNEGDSFDHGLIVPFLVRPPPPCKTERYRNKGLRLDLSRHDRGTRLEESRFDAA